MPPPLSTRHRECALLGRLKRAGRVPERLDNLLATGAAARIAPVSGSEALLDAGEGGRWPAGSDSLGRWRLLCSQMVGSPWHQALGKRGQTRHLASKPFRASGRGALRRAFFQLLHKGSRRLRRGPPSKYSP